MSDQPRLVVVGLGDVGLPLAVALARRYPVVGFDVDPSRIADLRAGRDRTGEVSAAALAEGRLELTDDPAAIAGAEIYIVAVPTPVGADKRPDLAAVRAASETV